MPSCSRMHTWITADSYPSSCGKVSVGRYSAHHPRPISLKLFYMMPPISRKKMPPLSGNGTSVRDERAHSRRSRETPHFDRRQIRRGEFIDMPGRTNLINTQSQNLHLIVALTCGCALADRSLSHFLHVRPVVPAAGIFGRRAKGVWIAVLRARTQL